MSGHPVLIVGIGASAGGVEAFRSFFENMPSDSGLAFVVILHLPVSRRSMLPDILARWTEMSVIHAEDGMTAEPNHIYVPPPHSRVGIEDGRLTIEASPEGAPRELRPIDTFFDSLARNRGERAIGIVLSGTGTDGSLGLKAIKEKGGITFAQGTDGSAPQYAGMPEGAIATGAVDFVLPVEKIPGELMRLVGPDKTSTPSGAEAEDARLAICAIVRAQLGHDFSGYKDKTFLRRVQRRMQALKIDSLKEYVARLETSRDEVKSLFRDLLIRVTSFFRDPEAFAAIEREVIPVLLNGERARQSLRIWVPGCATGEEAYSLAILFSEALDKVPNPPKVQLYATDIDDAAITIARVGRYPMTLVEGLSSDRLARFFHASKSGYVVAKQIRELCTFSVHSIVKNPPFSRMDLISCRNLLIYLDLEQQSAIIPTFHYALAPGGFLLLGRSETATRFQDLFETVDQVAKIFKRRDIRTPPLSLNPWSGEKPPFSGGNAPSPMQPIIQTSQERKVAEASRKSMYGVKPEGLPAMSSKPSTSTGLSFMLHFLTAIKILPPYLAQQNAELVKAQVKLQEVREEYQTVAEELRSANEELHSVNEELQSTNEELETSKEEIQSINEELQTVNARLSEKVDELDRTNNDLRNLFDSTQIATIFLDRHLLVRSFTPAVATIYNLIPSDHGRPLTDIVHKIRYDNLRSDVTKVLDELVPLERRVSSEDGKTHYLLRILPYRSSDSSVSGVLVTFLDVTSIVHAEQHQRLMVDELNHRVKNMLTVVISLANQTLKRSTSLDDFSKAYIGRLHALTASYSLLAAKNWSDVNLKDVLIAETKPFARTDFVNVMMHGPNVSVSAAAALAIGMAVHELTTNAVKYGALSVPNGTVTMDWRLDNAESGPELHLEWREAGGPQVVPPTHRGFGLHLIERGFSHEMSGQADISFEPEGLRATLRAPIGVENRIGVLPEKAEAS